MDSSWVTESAPWRIAVPMQSDPVSPPPITMTCRAEARIGSLLWIGSLPMRRFCCGKNSIAKCTPVRSRPRTGKITRLLGAAGEHDRVESFEEGRGIEIDPYIHAIVEMHAFRLHLDNAAVDYMFFHLEIGNAIAQQTARLGVFLIDMDFVPSARELLRAGKPRGSRTDNGGTFLPVFAPAGSGLIQPFAQARSTIAHSMVLIVTGLSSMFSVQAASQAPGKSWPVSLRKVIGRMKIAGRLLPIGAVDEIVPIWDLIVDRATAVAKRDAAIHAARRLILGRFLGKRDHEFLVMTNPVGRRRIAPVAPVDFKEAGYLAHPSQNPLDHDCFKRDL